MNILVIGDLVGQPAVRYAADRIRELRARYAVDLVVVNAENAAFDASAGTYGTDQATVDTLLAAGADVITGGNHTWDRTDATMVLTNPRVLRPANVPAVWPGHGSVTLDVAGEPVTVVNLAHTDAISAATPLWAAWQAVDRQGTVVIDLHAMEPLTKRGFALAVDGQAAAVIGTHTHEPSLALDILPGGTAFVTEVGFTGPSGAAGGLAAEVVVGEIRGNRDPRAPTALANGPMVLAAVLITVSDGHATAIQRLI
jgi:metallophosphoesterase (TIGR00282 family)